MRQEQTSGKAAAALAGGSSTETRAGQESDPTGLASPGPGAARAASSQSAAAETASGTRLGIKVKLFCAFAVLTALTVVAGLVAWWIFHDMHRSLHRVAHKDMLSLVEAVSLIDMGSEISTTAAALAQSVDNEARERETDALRRLEREFAAGVERLREVADHEAEIAALKSLAERLAALVAAVDTAVEEALDLTTARERAIGRLDEVHDSMMDAIDARIDHITSQAGGTTETQQGTKTLAALLHLRGTAEFALDLLREGVAARDPRQLALRRDKYAEAASRLSDALAGLPESLRTDRLGAAVDTIAGLGAGPDAVLALREREMAARAETIAILDILRTEETAFGTTIKDLVDSIHRGTDQAAARASTLIERGEATMIALTLASTVFALCVMLFYVGRRIIRPIETITDTMSNLAAGDTTVDVPYRSRGDELGRMAQALGVFRDTAIEVQASNLREIHAARRRLADAIESISEAFSLYDGEDRLVICNEKYRSLLYPEIADTVVPGTTFTTIIRRAAEQGLIKDAEGRIDDWIEERLVHHRSPGEPHLQQRGDGRWIMVSERRTQEGGTVAVYSDITDLKEREQELAHKSAALEQLSAQLSKYLSPQVYESIFTGRQEVTLASRRKKLTVFFSDIAGFTETTDRMESEELTALLNHYLTEMSHIALAYGATIDKFVGDAILIFFGDPETRGVQEDALACVRMAVAMQRRMGELEVLWRASGIGQPLHCRMGISTGYCTVGNFGSEDRFDYTIIGGTVNLASRLENAAAPGEVLLSYETYALVHNEIACEELPPLTVKGLPYPVAPYRVVLGGAPRAEGDSQIAERSDNMSLELNPDAMTEEERARAAALLKAALDRVGGGT